MNEYEIGGVMALMTDEQADRWNSGDTNELDMLEVMCVIPSREGGGSRVVDGEVVVNDGFLVTQNIPLCEALGDNELSKMMDGMPANRTR